MRLAFFTLFGLIIACAVAQTAVHDPRDFGAPFDRYTCIDKFSRTITFYLSKPQTQKKLPLCLIVLGSGGQSIWTPKDGRLFGSFQTVLRSQARDRVRVLAVEKPGVPFGFQDNEPGSGRGATKEFLEEHTLDRWSEANDAAIRACLKLSDIDPARILLIGHSEGGIVAARIAALDSRVTDVAVLAGGGPTQLFDFLQMFGRDETLKTWADIQRDPMSTTKFAWGHPYRRWSTFLATSPVEEALRSKARFFIGQGTADKNSFPLSADVLYATLLTRKRDVQMAQVVDADHGFNPPNTQGSPEGMKAMFDQVLDWFLKEKKMK